MATRKKVISPKNKKGISKKAKLVRPSKTKRVKSKTTKTSSKKKMTAKKPIKKTASKKNTVKKVVQKSKTVSQSKIKIVAKKVKQPKPDTTLSCHTCGKEEIVNFEYIWVHSGWPRCCNEGMHIEDSNVKIGEIMNQNWVKSGGYGKSINLAI